MFFHPPSDSQKGGKSSYPNLLVVQELVVSMSTQLAGTIQLFNEVVKYVESDNSKSASQRLFFGNLTKFCRDTNWRMKATEIAAAFKKRRSSNSAKHIFSILEESSGFSPSMIKSLLDLPRIVKKPS